VQLVETAVSEYCGLLSDNKQWPFDSPLVVFYDGTDYYLADGFHRYIAAKRAGRSSAPCQVINGSVRDAVKFALSANARHGLRRTNEDKRKAVTTALEDTEWRNLSSRAIGELCGVSHNFVETLRKPQVSSDDTCAKKQTAKHETTEKRLGKNGVSQSAKKTPDKVKEPAIVETYDESATDSDVPFAEQRAMAASIHGSATLLDKLVDTIRELSERSGGVWIDLASVELAAKSLKAEIRAAAFWTVCPACDGKGCKECRRHGWLSKARKPFLTAEMAAKMEAAK
jgi:hypothetical protein